MSLKLITKLTPQEIASICDHTFLNRSEAFKVKAEKGQNPIELRKQAFYKFLEETVSSQLQPYAICIRPEDVRHAKAYLEDKVGGGEIKIASVAGFPDGAWYVQNLK